MDITLINPEMLTPPHEVRDQNKLDTLTAAMSQHGWVGRPLVVNGTKYDSWTGSHRIQAAINAGLQSVPCYLVPEEAFEAVQDNPGWDRLYNTPCDSDMLIPDLRDAGLDDLADLLAQN